MSFEQYMISRNNEAFIITQYLVDDKKEMYVKATQILGPLDNLERNRTDYVFTLGELEGLFVAKVADGIILTKEQIEEYGL